MARLIRSGLYFSVFLLAHGVVFTSRALAEDATWKVTLDGEGFRECARDRFVELSTQEGVFQLAPTFLISDAMARSVKIREDLSAGLEAKKILHLDAPCQQVEVLFYVNWRKEPAKDPVSISVNGHPYSHHQDVEKMLTGGWDRFTIPGERLAVGANEIIFSGTGSLYVDADNPAGNSFKRLSAGSPWKANILGPDHNLEGEYIIRFRVHGHPKEGVITSPILDLAKGKPDQPENAVAPVLEMEEIRLTAMSEEPPGTSIEYEIRSGSTSDFVPAQWSEWVPASEIDRAPKERFVQWRAILKTTDSSVTPLLKGVTVEAKGKVSGANRERVQVSEAPDNQVAKSSYEFTYSNPHHPRMRHLREKYCLDDVVKAGQTDAEKMMLLSQWIREQWEGWDLGKYNYCPQWDALEVLELAPAGLGLGMCTHYAATFVQCAASLGYHARSIIVDHHCLAEAWSDHYGKWFFVDTGLVAKHPLAFQYLSNGVPINALELHERFLKDDASDVTVVPEPPFSQEEWWKRYLNLYCRWGMPLRNDHLYNPEPQELEHGHQQYHWDGYLWWTDSLDPKYPEYSLQTNRPEDYYWTLNKTLIDIRDTDHGGKLAVRLHGPIPNLETFQVRSEGGRWRESPPEFEWELQPGTNTLEARAVNTMGIECPANRSVVDYGPHP